jgi:malate dehydrogenase (oxaloacetate-decarboxylating)
MPSRDEAAERTAKLAAESVARHARYRGKMQTMPKCPVSGIGDFAYWYTPGVAAPCREIERNPERAYELTNKGNCVAIVTDGSRVLGLGDIGPEASLPVMEGKALLFKYLGGVDAVPICLATRDTDEIVRIVQALAPAFGGINLEDISQPKCFRVLEALRETCAIPVWHDDQQGSAVVALAGLINAAKLVGKDVRGLRVTLVGAGAAGVATYRLLAAAGIDPKAAVVCDSKGTLHAGRSDIAENAETFREKWRICRESNGERIAGGIAEALHGADACIAFSRPGPGVIDPRWVHGMAPRAIVFACANPVPEIWPDAALAAGAAVVGTGRSDLPNQVNNSLSFPGIFRGVLDVRARTITDGMALAAARRLAQAAEARGLTPQRILPAMADWQVAAELAAAVAETAQAEGVARLPLPADEVRRGARDRIAAARRAADRIAADLVGDPLPAPALNEK